MIAWEYKFVNASTLCWEDMALVLNNLGKQGWEVVYMEPNTNKCVSSSFWQRIAYWFNFRYRLMLWRAQRWNKKQAEESGRAYNPRLTIIYLKRPLEPGRQGE